MKKVATLFIIICFGLVLTGIVRETRRAETLPTLAPSAPAPTHPNNFFDPRYFTPEYSVKKELWDEKICGAVVPHHLLAHQMIAEVFSKIQDAPPNLLILVGPNHKNIGSRILVSSLGWQTPFGTVEVDKEAVDYLLATHMVKQDDYAFSAEHSMGNLMPFVKYYLPNTKVVPIICHHDVSKKEAEQLAEHLSPLLKKGAVIVASVDFSHYLASQEAVQMDSETLKAIREKDWDRIFAMDNDHLDSPSALGILFFAMENMGITDFTVLDNTNSGILLGNDMIETTSYISMLFSKQKDS